MPTKKDIKIRFTIVRSKNWNKLTLFIDDKKIDSMGCELTSDIKWIRRELLKYVGFPTNTSPPKGKVKYKVKK